MMEVLAMLAGLIGPQSESETARVPGGDVLPAEAALAEKYRRRDAGRDDWTSERVTERTHAQLERLREWVEETGESATPEAPSGLFAADATVMELRPAAAREIFRDEHLSVSRWAPDDGEGERLAVSESLAGWRRSFEGDGEGPPARVHFKTLEIQAAADGARSRVHVELVREGRLQQTLDWELAWRGADGEDLEIAELVVQAFEEVRVLGDAGTLFRDCTRAVLAPLGELGELAYGREHWAGRLDSALGVSIIGHEGFALGDLDGDGADDLFVCQPGGLANRVLVRRPDGTVEDRAAELGLDLLDHTRSALILDFDGDGDRDLLLSMDPRLVFFENTGAAFRPRAALTVESVTALSAADYDGDGDLDVYACAYMLPDARERSPVPYHDANNGRANALVRNEGEWRFVDATVESGLDENNRRFSFAAAWEDYDNDGDPDLYVSNDFGRNNLYRNEGGHFEDVAAEAGVEDIAAGMGVSWADVDHDGWMDLYVSNMFSSAGERVTYQRQFRPEIDADVRGLYQRHARGNTLFRNDGEGGFQDVSVERGVTQGRWAWGALFLDVNNDGWQDVYVPNGFVTGESTDDL